MFDNQEKDLLIKILSDVKIHPLATDSIALLSIIQNIAKKIVAASSDSDAQMLNADLNSGGDIIERKRKQKKADDDFSS